MRYFYKIVAVFCLTTGVLSGANLSSSALAAIVGRVCGNFLDGGQLNGTITVEEDGSFIEANITSTTASGNPRSYTGNDFESNDMTTHPEDGFDAFLYTFRFSSSPFPANRLEIYLPKGENDLVDFNTAGIPDRYNQFEVRDNNVRKDVDKRPEEVPEPLTILGSVTALASGIAIKRKQRKLSEEA